ncbi:MAG: hypothetical protein ABIU84_17855 [Thermoanaerobaculia bacterium]
MKKEVTTVLPAASLSKVRARTRTFAVALGNPGPGLCDLWKDPNRRVGHDRAVDTVVARSARAPR